MFDYDENLSWIPEENTLKQEAENNSKIIHYTMSEEHTNNVNKTHKTNTQTFIVQLEMSEDNLSFFYAFFLIFTPFCINYYKCVFPCLRVYQGQCVGGAERAETRSGPFKPR